ncbi:MAG: DEAD/DEAH box helicase [Leptospiraceae bacterium]|nr:DEAD/DEAH box helicase [Leptospiraceae bacterium]MCP5499332.1 DEAD/DEAH box helicase [Leptospiraceae bacterium]
MTSNSSNLYTSNLDVLLHNYRTVSRTEREKGTYFEELALAYFRYEPTYSDLYEKVWKYADWAKESGISGMDTGIDLVAKTKGTEEYHAIQCKFYAENHRVQKSDIDSFFTASGKKPFTHRIIIATTNNWSEHAEDALIGQNPPVTKIDLHDLKSSQIDWTKFHPDKKPVLKEKKKLRNHQKLAVNSVIEGLKTSDRGKLIMACGTGKTFTSLKIAEKEAGKGKWVLFLVPSLALLSQTLTEWTQESEVPLHSFAVCSDSEIGKKRKKNEELVETFSHELRYPANTNPDRLAFEMKKRHDSEHMSVVFSTYHSIDVIHEAQRKHKLGEFDLVICDEAHRTTGATFADQDESNFVKIHDAKYIKAAKRLYMTATPRIYADIAKVSAERENVTLCSMDDESIYGKQLYVLTFSDAVSQDLLVDYKVIVLAVDEAHISHRLQTLLADEDNNIKVDDAAKIIGCWKALNKQGANDELLDDAEPMKRAVAFCQVIEYNKNARTHKVSSKTIAGMFQEVVEAYKEKDPFPNGLNCIAEHVDGSMNATEKESRIQWLKESSDDNTCRILSNVRCLSEGVDVPALDAVLFLTPRSSQVDVVQSVGRVMRKSPGKNKGYVILPVVIPSGVQPHEALNDNKTYKVVWQVLQALRSHDDRFDAMINKMELVGPDKSKMEVIAVTDKIGKKTKSSSDKQNIARGKDNLGKTKSSVSTAKEDKQQTLKFDIGEIEIAIYARVVEKCGNRHHWEDWANDIARIANTHITRIKTIIGKKENTKEIKAFDEFVEELRDDLNDSISRDEVVEMLAQHLITKPVFDALFSSYEFAKQNPVSMAMDKVLKQLEKHNIQKEADTLERFYASVKLRAEGIDNAEGKQKIILELYDKFFRNAFPRLTDRLGIVYTPVEAVDFIIHSVNDVLKQEFGQTLGSDKVHILDPFTGTGTFITRLMQSGLISPAELKKKYKNQIHANEIVLLAYYIAAINIEATYHDIVSQASSLHSLQDDYIPFEGILLTDTFQLYEKEDLISRVLVDNSERRKRQKSLPIKVIICNPPYSAGQSSANDNNQNIKYPALDARIEETYVRHSTSTNKNALYDSYIRAIRWASDRIGNNGGVMGFITNAGFTESNAMSGVRKCLQDEFSSIYIFHLRGNARTSGELRRKEKDNVFGQGTRTPIAITILVKNPKAKKQGNIYLHDIGDYLSQQEKLDKIKDLQSIEGITKQKLWKKITPDKYNDWLNQRDDSFYEYISLGNKKDKTQTVLFENYSAGVKTNRDPWVYNSSQKELIHSVKEMIDFYNSEVDRYSKACKGKQKDKYPKVDDFINTNTTKLSWVRSTKNDLAKFNKRNYEKSSLVKSYYRPFFKQNMYYSRIFNDMVYQMPQIFPEADSENLVMYMSGLGNSGKDFSVVMVDTIPDLNMQHSGGQGFPLYLYDKAEAKEDNLFSKSSSKSNKRYAITDEGLAHFQKAYPKEKISKEDIFYYIYGLLHSPTYREKYADNLSKELPRIPCVKRIEDFQAFSKAGRDLAKLHIGYETVKPYPVSIHVAKGLRALALKPEHYYVTQMKYGKTGKKEDRTRLIYNEYISLSEIPLEAYDYIVNGKPALDWIVERYCVKTDKASGITNDANLWGIETENNPKYPLELFQRVITVSLETMKIVNVLPEMLV